MFSVSDFDTYIVEELQWQVNIYLLENGNLYFYFL